MFNKFQTFYHDPFRQSRCKYKDHHESNAENIQTYTQVKHPHELAEKQLSGKGGAILTIRAGSKERAYKLINHLKYVKIATNIGDVRTLVIHPASTIYIHTTPEAMAEAGEYDDTIRISVGIEDIKDLIQDFTEAVESLGEE